jgi:hypothetical protein
MPAWETVSLIVEGARIAAVAPVLVSASRRTDIPAFHADWLLRRIEAGYVKWVNPFSGAPQYVSFAKTRVIVFWTKNPRPLLTHLDALDRRGVGYYFQFTLNDYEPEGLEPGVPGLTQRIETFRELSRRIGKEKIVWRYDPILLTRELDVDRLAERVARIGDALHGCTGKLVFAFADIERYGKVRRRLQGSGTGGREPTNQEMREIGGRLAGLARSRGMAIAACAESIDLTDLGISRSKCIDDELLLWLFPRDPELARFLGPAETRGRLKDKGQRKECGCIISKDIGTYDTCPHLCRYCYANTSDRAVRSAIARKALEID